MKKITMLIFLSAMVCLTSIAQKQKKCVLVCNLTTAYVCPGSNSWKANPEIYNDAELMTELGYKKDQNGCWKLQGSTTRKIKGDESKLEVWYQKLKKIFRVEKKDQ